MPRISKRAMSYATILAAAGLWISSGQRPDQPQPDHGVKSGGIYKIRHVIVIMQ